MKQRMRDVVLRLRSICFFAAFACNDVAAPPSAPTTVMRAHAGDAATPSTERLAPAEPPPSPLTSASAGDAGLDFYSCGVDSDCVAVPKATCCPTGLLEAVNKQSVDAYRESFVCEGRHGMCPKFRMRDVRQSLCNNESRRCEMVQPDRIVCDGSGPNPHACPNGSRCDGAGRCDTANH
jgi:hypothetical protein